MDSISYTLLETSLENSVDDFLNRFLADVKIDNSNNNKNMSTEQMNFLKAQISSIIDVEIETVMKTLNTMIDNENEENNENSFSEENQNSFSEITAVSKMPMSRKEESVLVKASDSDAISELDLALIISKSDSLENSMNKKTFIAIKPDDYHSDNSVLRSRLKLGGSQLMEKLKKIIPSPEMVKKVKIHNNNEPKIQNKENLQTLVNQTQDKYLEIALALSSADEKEKEKEQIQESVDREDQNLYNGLIMENERLRQLLEKKEIELTMKRKDEEKKRRESQRLEIENFEIRKRILKTIKDCIKDSDLKSHTKLSMKRIKLWMDCYNALSNTRSLDNILKNEDDLSVNDISLIILELCSILKKSDKGLISDLFTSIQSHAEEISNICLEFETMCLFDNKEHIIDETVDSLHPIFLTEFERVQIKGDGNCLWNSISVSMFGDYSFMESLRLLTAATLIKYKHYFESSINEQRVKFGYRHGLTFEQLIDASTELTVWGDEYHLLALSLALRRPIISYGSFAQIPNLRDDMSYEELKFEYERENQINHMLYVGNSEDKHKTPVCIYYNGENHYCAILPKQRDAKPIIPKTQLFDYVIDKEKQRLSGTETIGIKNSHFSAYDLQRRRNHLFTTSFLEKNEIKRSNNFLRPESLNRKFANYSAFDEKTEKDSNKTKERSISKNEIQESRFNSVTNARIK